MKMIETKRLRIYPASRSQMESMIENEPEAELQKAYREMLEGCLKNPELWDWFAMWMVELHDKTHVGDLCFKGLGSDGVAEIGYGLLEDFWGKGYATEAVKALLSWAFQHSEVTAIEAETEDSNLASQRVLQKCGFKPNGKIGEEGPRFVLARADFKESKENF